MDRFIVGEKVVGDMGTLILKSNMDRFIAYQLNAIVNM